MTSNAGLLIVIAACAVFCAGAYAQSPREELKQLTAQLQKTPTDDALREKIIKLAAKVRPAPAVPEEAQRREGRAKFAFKTAKSNDDYLSAAREYEEAVRVAPWISGYYVDLCTIYEKAEKYAEAKRHCEFALIGLGDPSQVSEMKQRIAGLEFGIEKTATGKNQWARATGTWVPVDAKSNPRDWQALRARARYPDDVFHRYRFLMQNNDKALFYMDQHGGKWNNAPDGFWTTVYTGTRTNNEWQWQMKVADGRCGENQVVRSVMLEILEQGNIIRTKNYALIKPTEFDLNGNQSGELSMYRRQGLPVTSGPAGCFVVELPAMFVRAGD
jgi:hypothetical protein